MNIFELATKSKLRFKVANGILGTEDLWDLSLESLNSLAKSLNKIPKDSEESFIEERSNTDKITELKFEVVKSVIATKIEEKKIAQDRNARDARRAELIRLIGEKAAHLELVIKALHPMPIALNLRRT